MKVINTRAWMGSVAGTIKLAGGPEAYINLIDQRHGSCTMHPDDAKALRDALNAIYPVEPKVVETVVEPAPTPYVVEERSDDSYIVGRYIPSREWEQIGVSYEFACAQKIADALNEVA